MKKILVITLSLIIVSAIALVFYFVFSDKKSDQNGELVIYVEKALSPHVPTENVNRYIYVNEKAPTLENYEIQPSQFKIINRLLPFSNSELRLEVDKITHVVLHFSSNVIAKPNEPFIPEDVINIFKQYGVSAHYLIARDGIIFKLVNENRIAYHAGKGSLSDYPSYTNKLNHHSIGIELLAIGTEDEMKQYISPEIYATIPKNYIGYTEEQYAALNFLLPQIYERHDIKVDRRHVIGHDEYSVGRKRDPGSLFDWTKIGL